MIVNNDTYKKRLTKCHACPHYAKKTRSCGTLLNRLNPSPDTTEYRGKEVSLCGCVIPVKVRMKISKCPIGKWKRDLNKYEMGEVARIAKEFGTGSISRERRKEFYRVYSLVYDNVTKTDEGCKPCFDRDLKEFMNYYNKKDE